MPAIQNAEVHGGAWAARLGGCFEMHGAEVEPVGTAGIAQIFYVPVNVTEAPLTFWYKVGTDEEDCDVSRDRFRVRLVRLGTGDPPTTIVGLFEDFITSPDIIKLFPFKLGGGKFKAKKQ